MSIFPKDQGGGGSKKSGLETKPGPEGRQQDGGGAGPRKQDPSNGQPPAPKTDKELAKAVKKMMADCKVKFYCANRNGSVTDQLTLDVTEDPSFECDTDFFVELTNTGKCTLLYYITVGKDAGGTLQRPTGHFLCGSLQKGENHRIHMINASKAVRSSTHLSCLYVKASSEGMTPENVSQFFESAEMMQYRSHLVTKSATISVKYRKSKLKKLTYG